MANMDSNKLAKTAEDEELVLPLGSGADPEGVEPVGPDVGQGLLGVVGVLVGEGAGKGESEEPETVMANFWPNWQCWPNVQMK